MDTTLPLSTKPALRQHFRAQRVALSAAHRAAEAGALCARLLAAPQLPAPQLPAPPGAVAVYLASPVELDLAAYIEVLLRRGQAVVAPRADSFALLTRTTGLPRDGRGIPLADGEPVEIEEIGRFLVPGVAFAENGVRLGQGGGWYDRILALRKPDALCVGIAFDEQLAVELPREAHDIAMDYLATPSRLIHCRAAAPGGPHGG